MFVSLTDPMTRIVLAGGSAMVSAVIQFKNYVSYSILYFSNNMCQQGLIHGGGAIYYKRWSYITYQPCMHPDPVLWHTLLS